MRHGTGKMIFDQSHYLKDYEGEWQDDKMHGKGTANVKNGDKYIGEYKNDMRNGHGRYIWSESNPGVYREYIGDWVDNIRHGFGTYEFKYGEKYQGQFIDDKMQGLGIYYYASGNRYEGEFF